MLQDKTYLLDILIAARRIIEYTGSLSREQFEANNEKQDAVIRMIQVIGEASRMLSPEFRQSHQEIPWREIIGMRHRLVHEYFDIDLDEVWRVIEQDIPLLIPQLERLVPSDE